MYMDYGWTKLPGMKEEEKILRDDAFPQLQLYVILVDFIITNL